MSWERGRDTAWAWIALTVAVVLALVVAPWDARTGRVLLDGTPQAAADTAGAGGLGDLAAAEADNAASDLAPGATSDNNVAFDDTSSPGTSGNSGSGSPSGSPSAPGSTPSTGSGGPGTGGDGPDQPTPGQHAGPGDNDSDNDGKGKGKGDDELPPVRSGTIGRGVTATEVRLGFIVLKNQEEAANDLGFGDAYPTSGDPPGQIRALEEWVNANGGIGGRELKAIIRNIDFRTSSSRDEQQACTGFTQDDEVFAAVLVAQIREPTRKCYSDAKTLAFDVGGYPVSGQMMAEGAPYLWSTNAPTLSDSTRALPSALADQDFWKPSGLQKDQCAVAPCLTGIVMYDFPNFERVLNEDLLPALQAQGITVDPNHVRRVNASDAATIEAGLGNAVLGLQAANVSRVLFLGGAPLAPFFMVQAEYQQYRPLYGITTFESPRFGTDNRNLVGDQMNGSRGLGFMPASDVRDEQYPHQTPMQRKCLAIYKDAGHTWEGHYDSRIAVSYCEAVLMIKHVADSTAPDLTPEIWADAASRLGTSYQTALALKARFTPQKRSGGSGYRYLAYDGACQCMVYKGPVREL